MSVSLAKITDCAWTTKACHASQERHGRVDDCPTHPWHRTPRQTGYPVVGHRAGLRANDLVTLASAFWIISLHGGTAQPGDPLWSGSNH